MAISDLIGSVADEAGGFVDDAVGEDLAKADALLSGKERPPTDIEKEEAKFSRGVDLATPDGELPSTAAAPNAVGGGTSHASTLAMGKRIEFIHFGQVHRDWARNFHHDQLLDDMKELDLSSVVGSRAICFRAALAREAVLLAGFARAAQAALAEKDEKEGATGDLLTAAADLLGGASGTAQTAVAADLEPFIAKIESEAWTPLNKILIRYQDLHTAGSKLHEVRANLRCYVREQLAAQKDKPKEEKGLLSDLPLIGELKIPGPFGEVIGFLQKITGKLYDVQTALIFELLIGMQDPIEKACLKVSLEQIKKRTVPIYPAWFRPPKPEEEAADQPFANFQQDDPLQGNIATLGPLSDVNEAFQDGVSKANEGINDGVAPVLEVIDFLSKEVEPAPGSPYLADVFSVKKEPTAPLFGSEALNDLAKGAFGRAIGGGEVPKFMEGFVTDMIGHVFSVCAEFLRAVYDKLCCLPPDGVIVADELVAAGRTHLLYKLIDLALEKSGLTDMLSELSLPMSDLNPGFLPSGINWPTQTLRPDPIIAMLKAKLTDELGPYLDPVIGYAMSGLAERLNDQRMWAAGSAMTMEVHLAALPSELALMFRNLFGPLWQFITDTVMGAVNDAMGEVLGPLGDAVGLAQDGLGAVTGAIADAKKKAAEAQAYAKNVEDKAKAFMDELSDMSLSTGDTSDIDNIKNAAENLAGAVTDDPFSEGGAGPGGGGGPSGPPFPGNRKKLGKAKKILTSDMEEVAPNLKWEEATAEPPPAAEGDEAEGAAQGAGAAAGGAS